MMKLNLSDRAKGVLKIIAGVVLIVVGLIGLIVPVIPGLIFLFFGFELLGFGLVMRTLVKKYTNYDIPDIDKKP